MKIFRSAAILAGGKSVRMGFDKRKIKARDRYIIENQIEVLKKEFDEIFLVTSPFSPITFDNCKTVYDEFLDSGPIGGIHKGLKSSSSEFVYFVGCDMPVINLDYIRFMRSRLNECPADICITANGSFVEPLNSFYAQSVSSSIENVLAANHKSLNEIFKLNLTKVISEISARAFDSNYDMFINLNYYGDVLRFEKILHKWTSRSISCA